jgi:HEAT repeat protein
MKTIFRSKFILSLSLAVAALTCRADDEQEQFKVLHSDASASKKWQAFQRLRVIGTAQAVPEVAPFLTDPELSQAARQTLDGLPYPQVDVVLREAVVKATGPAKAGIIDSIGWRAKPDSERVLAPLLSDSDTNVSAAAATALGRIGSKKAVADLLRARDNAVPAVQWAVLAGLLNAADGLSAHHEGAAAAIYAKLNESQYPMAIRTAAWRGLILTDAQHREKMMLEALSGQDQALEVVARKVLGEAKDRSLLKACAAHWAELPAESQLALIDAEVMEGYSDTALVRAASQSTNQTLRIAALRAMGKLNDVSFVPNLAQAASTSKGPEREAARESLACLRGPDVSGALRKELKESSGPEKAELLRALGARQDREAVAVLIENASAGDEPVRLAALESIRAIAPPDALEPLLAVAGSQVSDDVREQTMEALSAICQAAPDKESASRTVIAAEEKPPAAEQGTFLPLLAELGSADGLSTVEKASRSDNLELAKAAVRALGQWPTAAPAEPLLELARTTQDASLKTLAVRSAIAVSATEPDATKRLTLLKETLAAADRPDEKREALSQLEQIDSPAALQTVFKEMDDPAVSNESAIAALDIAEKLAKAHPKLADQAAVKVLKQHSEGELFQRAFALRIKHIKKIPFIRDWVVCGPFSKSGVVGALAVFDVPFGPELADKTVEWKTAPEQNEINLAAIFPGAENCAAYLRTTLIVPDECPAVLLMGSDDGVKAWLNGAVVHRHNVDRPEVPDEDVVPVHLNKGANELVLKISQGGGGWGACARIAGVNGDAIPGLQLERPTGAAGALAGTQ